MRCAPGLRLVDGGPSPAVSLERPQARAALRWDLPPCTTRMSPPPKASGTPGKLQPRSDFTAESDSSACGGDTEHYACLSGMFSHVRIHLIVLRGSGEPGRGLPPGRCCGYLAGPGHCPRGLDNVPGAWTLSPRPGVPGSRFPTPRFPQLFGWGAPGACSSPDLPAPGVTPWGDPRLVVV